MPVIVENEDEHWAYFAAAIGIVQAGSDKDSLETAGRLIAMGITRIVRAELRLLQRSESRPGT